MREGVAGKSVCGQHHVLPCHLSNPLEEGFGLHCGVSVPQTEP